MAKLDVTKLPWDSKAILSGNPDELERYLKKFLLALQKIQDNTVNIVNFNDDNIVIKKASGNGIKVDQKNPTFGFEDIIGDQFSKNTGATKPSLTAYNGVINAWRFGAGKEAFMTFHIPHDYVKGSNIFLHIHWSQISTTNTGGTLDFKHTSIYAKAHNQASFNSTPITKTFTTEDAGIIRYRQFLTEIQISSTSPIGGEQFDSDDLEPDGVIEMTFEMDANNLTDSSGVTNPFIHYVDIHYQSTGIPTKAKAPDFYV